MQYCCHLQKNKCCTNQPGFKNLTGLQNIKLFYEKDVATVDAGTNIYLCIGTGRCAVHAILANRIGCTAIS
jgi:hypothetical protein